MNIVDEDKLELKTFSVRERNPKIIRHAKNCLLYTSPSPRDCQ